MTNIEAVKEQLEVARTTYTRQSTITNFKSMRELELKLEHARYLAQPA